MTAVRKGLVNLVTKIKRALISVSDKTGLEKFAKALVDMGVEILSTGGTKAALDKAGIPCTAVEEYTGFPEMMGGRVKTLHPKFTPQVQLSHRAFQLFFCLINCSRS